MERVTGIGGLFFRAQDPGHLATWYAQHLGVDAAPESYETSSWWQQTGPTVFAAMPADSDHFGGPERSWAVNFRVDPEEYPNGRFASLRDPEGNAVQLWQPAGADLRGPS